MSIAVTALQYLTMMVLREVPLIGDNVLDNPLDPFPANTIAKPTVAVYVGEDVREEVDEQGLFGAQHRVELSIQTFLPASVTLTVNGQQLKLSGRGNGLQFVLGQIGGEIDRKLVLGDSEACQLWRLMVGGSPEKVTVTPWLMQIGDGAKNGIRVPAVERLLVVKTPADPLFEADEELPEFWDRVIALFEADEEFAPVASLIRALATGLGDLPSWRVAQGKLGTTEDGVKAMGLAPYADHEADDAAEAAELVEITLDPLGVTADEVLPPDED